MNDDRKLCRFITTNYDPLFTIEDGKFIQITRDGETVLHPCRYIDDYHTYIGYRVFHICEFAETMEDRRADYQPEPLFTKDKGVWEIRGECGKYLSIRKTPEGFVYTLCDKNMDPLKRRKITTDQTIQDVRKTILEDLGFGYASLKEVHSFEKDPDRFIDHFYVVEDLQKRGPLDITEYSTVEDALRAYMDLPSDKLKALGVAKVPDPLPGSLDMIQCINGQNKGITDHTQESGWKNPEILRVVDKLASLLELKAISIDPKVRISLGNGYSLVATVADYRSDFDREIYVGIETDDGSWKQDLACIMNDYSFDDKGDMRYKDGKFKVLVYADSDSDDATNVFEIAQSQDL